MYGGSVTMDGSTIANCSGTASSMVHSSRVVGHWAGVRCVGGCGGWLVLLGGVKGEVVRVCVCVRHGSRLYGFAYVSADRERC